MIKKVLPANAILVPDSAEKVFTGEIFDVYQWPQTQFDGSVKTFEMLRRPDTVQVLVVRDGKILLVHDEQPGREVRLHLPGGRVDEVDGDWLTAAKRELLEETGLVCAEWRLVHVRQPQAKIEWFVATYLATGIEEEHAQAVDAGGEKITPEWRDYTSLRDEIMDDDVSSLSHFAVMFNRLKSVDELLSLPEFQGEAVQR